MVNKLALDDAGRVLITSAPVTNAARIAAQAYLMDCACVDAGAVSATADSFNSGFRYTASGALRVSDATAGLPASTSTNQGIAMTDDGQACYTTDAIGADVAYLNGAAVDSSGRFYATLVDPIAWLRFNIGITETGQGVSTWADQTANGNDLVQGTDAARPPKQSDGSILFNGVDEYLKAATFDWNLPVTVYILGRQITWTANDRWFDGDANASLIVQQAGSVNTVRWVGVVATQVAMPLNTYAVLTAVAPAGGTASFVQVNRTVSGTGDPVVADPDGFTLGTAGNGAGNWANIQVKEVILFSGAHAMNTRLHLVKYLSHNGPVTL